MSLVATSWTFNFSLCSGVCYSLAQSHWISIRRQEDYCGKLGEGDAVLTGILDIVSGDACLLWVLLNFRISVVLNYMCCAATQDFEIPVICIPLSKITVNGLSHEQEDKTSGQCQSYLADGAWVVSNIIIISSVKHIIDVYRPGKWDPWSYSHASISHPARCCHLSRHRARPHLNK